MIKVFGHIAPDTDATGSAILMAWYLSTFTSQKAEAFVLGPLNKETQFMLNHWGVKEPQLLEKIEKGEKVVIVDTNNPQELFSNINDSEIFHIVDHHKLVGGLMTSGPVTVTMLPLASTASVIHHLIGRENEEKMPKEISGVMLSCILSDTLAFRSPTTTPHDKGLAERLAVKLNININEYSTKMFKAKSDVSDFTDHGLIHLDSEKFEVGDKNFRVSVCETTDPENILKRYDGIVETIGRIKEEDKGIEDVLFFVVDILKEEAIVFTPNNYVRKVISASFDVDVQGKTHILPGVVSRKKQIVPSLKLPN